MVAPAVGTPEPPSSWGGGAELVVDWRGPHALIRRYGEPAVEAEILSTIPAIPGNLLVVASPAAHGHPELLAAIRGCLISVWARPGEPRPRAAWLAVSELGNPDGDSADWVYGLAAEAGIEVFAPHGGVRTLLGAGTYVDRAVGGTGWRRFSPTSAADVVGCRFPTPLWEYQLPHIPLRAAGLVTEPIPAGLAVHAEGAVSQSHRDLAFRVPMNPRIPKIVLGGPGVDLPAAAVAELFALFPPHVRPELLVVPGSARMTRPEWLREFARLAGHDVAVSAGSQLVNSRRGTRTVVLGERGDEQLTPFPALFLQRPDAELPEIIDIAPAPLGWALAGPRTYQPVRDSLHGDPVFPGAVVEVVPGGLAVYAEGNVPMVTSFDPAGWTLGVGTHGVAVTEVELAAVRSLLNGLTAQQRRTARVQVFGDIDPGVRAVLETYVRAAGATPFTPVSPEQPPAPAVQAAPVPAEPPEPAVPEPSTPSEPPPALPPRVPPVAVTAVPVATVSAPGRPEPKRGPSSPPSAPAPEPDPEPVPVVVEDVPEPAPPSPPAPPLEAPAPPVRRGPVEPIAAADRSSTATEQARLNESAGSRYTEALATVNVALSAWPMLRPEAKADYVAVCLYLGGGEGGGVSLNNALAAGEPMPFEGYLPCLMSGLRRLPTHRQVLLRQENLDDGDECAVPVGAVLMEPTFLSASARLDITTSSASLDVLIWPVSARRTSELVMGRSVEEAVFPPGRRFKVLAIKTDTEETEDEEGPSIPRTALLARELLAAEDPHSADAVARDGVALSRLERAWTARRSTGARLVDDPDVVARLTTPLTVAAESGQAATASANGSLEMVS